MMNSMCTKSARIVPCFVTAILHALIGLLHLLRRRHSPIMKPRVGKRQVSGASLILWTLTSGTRIHLTGALAMHQHLESLPQPVVCQQITRVVHVGASS